MFIQNRKFDMHTSHLHNTTCQYLFFTSLSARNCCHLSIIVYKVGSVGFGWKSVFKCFQARWGYPFTRSFKIYFRFYYYRESCRLVRQLFSSCRLNRNRSTKWRRHNAGVMCVLWTVPGHRRCQLQSHRQEGSGRRPQSAERSESKFNLLNLIYLFSFKVP